MLLEDLMQAKILIVDDDTDNIRLMKDVMKIGGFQHVKATDDPRGVLALFVEFEPDLIVLDLNMPHISGFELLKMMQPLIGDNDYLPILVITAEHSYDSRRLALTSGASDLMTKPYMADEVLVRVTNMLRLRSRTVRLQEQVRQRTTDLERYQTDLEDAQLETIVRLARAAEHRDDETGKHTQRVGALCALLAGKLGWSSHQVQLMEYAAPLHDVGKIGIPDSILLKPGKFTEIERKIMQRHAKIGASLLAGGHSEILRVAECIALNHHERWNGEGYPRQLKGEDIAIEGRILAVVDVFDALTHDRPYKTAWSLDEARNEISDQRGKQFDPQITDAFLKIPDAELLQVCA